MNMNNEMQSNSEVDELIRPYFNLLSDLRQEIDLCRAELENAEATNKIMAQDQTRLLSELSKERAEHAMLKVHYDKLNHYANQLEAATLPITNLIARKHRLDTEEQKPFVPQVRRPITKTMAG